MIESTIGTEPSKKSLLTVFSYTFLYVHHWLCIVLVRLIISVAALLNVFRLLPMSVRLLSCFERDEFIFNTLLCAVGHNY
jgi:hypothetical protein